MADIDIPNQFAFEAVIPSGGMNDNFDEVEEKFNESIGSIINDAGYPAGAVALANGAGVPTMTAISGDATLSGTGVLQLAAGVIGASELASDSVGEGPINFFTGTDNLDVDTATGTTEITVAEVPSVPPGLYLAIGNAFFNRTTQPVSHVMRAELTTTAGTATRLPSADVAPAQAFCNLGYNQTDVGPTTVMAIFTVTVTATIALRAERTSGDTGSQTDAESTGLVVFGVKT